MRNLMHKIAVFALALAISLSVVGVLPARAATDATFSVAVENASYYGGERATVSIQTTAVTAAGMYAKLKYDTEVLSLVQTTVNEQAITGLITGVKDGCLILTWSSESNRMIPAGSIVELQFQIRSDAAVQEYILELEVVELLDEEMQNLTVGSTNGTVKVVTKTASAQVQKVIGLISAIGEVKSADTATGKKVNDAKDAFLALSAADKKAVTNYDVLVAANSKYQLLKEEQYAADNTAALQEIINKFKADHARVIALKPEDGKISDLAQVNEALADYAQQSAYIRKKLEAEQKNLLAVKAEIQKQIDAADAQAAAEEMAKGYREQFASLLNASTDSIVLDPAFKAELEAALSTYTDAFTPLAQELLKEEYAHIQQMLATYLKLEAENAPEPEEVINAYNSFREKYRSILLKSEMEVTAEDAQLLNAAIADYYTLGDQAKGKLAGEFEHIMNLLFALELAGIEVAEPTTPTTPITPTEPGSSNGGGNTVIVPSPGNVDLTVGASLGKNVKLLYWILLVAVLLFAVSIVSYILIRRKVRKEGDHES